MKTLAAAAVLLLAVSAGAQVPTERVLLPLYLENPVPGAFGSVWVSELAIHNPAQSGEVQIQPCSLRPDETCLTVLYNDEKLDPNETQTVLPRRYLEHHGGGVGAVVYVRGLRTDPARVGFQLRIADTSRAALTAGTQIPVVRDAELLTGIARLLAIPADSRFRLTFRLYELDLDQSKFLVRVYDQASGALLDTRTLELAVREPERRPHFEPAYAEIADFGSLAAPGRLQVEIEPLTAGARFWAFVSITNNETQQITLVTPE